MWQLCFYVDSFQNLFIALSQDKIIQIKAHLSDDIVIQGFLANELKAECFVKAFSLMIICDNVNTQRLDLAIFGKWDYIIKEKSSDMFSVKCRVYGKYMKNEKLSRRSCGMPVCCIIAVGCFVVADNAGNKTVVFVNREKFSKFCMCDMGIYSNGFGYQYQAFCAIM